MIWNAKNVWKFVFNVSKNLNVKVSIYFIYKIKNFILKILKKKKNLYLFL